MTEMVILFKYVIIIKQTNKQTVTISAEVNTR